VAALRQFGGVSAGGRRPVAVSVVPKAKFRAGGFEHFGDRGGKTYF
jgi:hypothetical protein